MPLDPYEAYAKGAAKDIEFLQGCNKNEVNYFLYIYGGAETFTNLMSKRLADNTVLLTDEEKALIESFRKDIKGESYESLCRLYD